MSINKNIFTILYSLARAAILLFIFSCLVIYSQNPQWIVYTTTNSGLPSNNIFPIAIDTNNIKWIGTSQGLAKFDGANWTIYDTSNSPLPEQSILDLKIDKKNHVWIGTFGGGAAYFDGTNWIIFDTSNSPIPSNLIKSIFIDKYNSKWIGTSNKGLAKFTDTTWLIYNTTNSGIPANNITTITIDSNNIKWIGTPLFGMARFNDTNWTVYNSNNTGQPINFVRGLAIDSLNNIWIGTQFYGLVNFNYSQNQWTVYNSTNSGLPDNNLFSVFTQRHIKYIGSFGFTIFNDTTWVNYNSNNSPLPGSVVNSFAQDKYGNIWMGVSGGLAEYNANGIIGIKNKQINSPLEFELYQNYPNPFNSSTAIEYYISKSGDYNLKLYDIQGKEVKQLISGELKSGSYKTTLNSDNLSSGVYFYLLSDKLKKYVITKKLVIAK
ncbi:MAG: T9SS C-terminal target domain-containing protein [Ignavibacteriae bacterium]|nr:MAG: T9SS C-terminal target domain-containing protein [Ignavibacteriota bacterium]